MGQRTSKGQSWASEHYDEKLSFVSEMGRGVIDLLEPAEGERILDLGCGTGDLTQEIAASKALVTGMDLSPSMLEKARIKYPNLNFVEGNAERFTVQEPLDAVFSNAALHWMKNAEDVVQCIHDALRPGGRFVAEFGGKHNVGTVVQAISEVLIEQGIDAGTRSPWYFPSIGEYSVLLEKHGFRVTYALHFDRPTPMQDGEAGLRHWLNGFASPFFTDASPEFLNRAYDEIAERTKAALYHEGTWNIDYKRLRIRAIKL
ncbi:class I SAM-dependent methyltransferase [Paenibacillus gallinarum]|uniref:Methyltransferase domain-containing protein n=1 Tax=Paenibacillus gallinarum TaxID=2762232 RepID=A0ABR8ST33_9BACL|nr:methyltransferase domain-containing protein [Paenibacillus gallinarum]MBD7966627.1 methyltransferase domain-containing protein [Paenibacillus gallinarum]